MQWFRFYSEALEDPKVQRLSAPLFKTWVNLLCLASKSDAGGVLPSPEDCAFALRMDFDTYVQQTTELLQRGLIDAHADHLSVHNWEGRQKRSDNVTARVHKHREQKQQDETFQKRSGNALEKNRVEEKRVEESTPPIPPTPMRRDPSPPDGGVKVRAAPKPSTLNAEQRRDFEEWYTRYPNKQHRPDAERAWRKLDPDVELMQTLAADTALRAQGRKWRDGYVEHPATYLNARVWEDDIEPVRAVPSRASPNGHPADPLEAQFGVTTAKSLRNLESVMRGNHAG